MDLNSIDLLLLQTTFMKNDPMTKALCNAINPHLQNIADNLNKVLLLSQVDNLDENILDQLAYDLHIEWYDSTADIAIKRILIKNSDMVHKYLGTPFAVSQVVNNYLNHGKLQEWFEYGGDPYHFRVLTISEDIADTTLVAKLTKAINMTKNIRSIFDGFVVTRSYAALRSYTHTQLAAHTHAQLAAGV